ncbi:hypothetical protein R5R35_008672 [Gryllus longicercus]|uniref:m7GpppX diphosphatase n=1 Tax=Gryllus longicercus TaxID=2509291 RepID=A0AAN9Z1E7_9ORTH
MALSSSSAGNNETLEITSPKRRKVSDSDDSVLTVNSDLKDLSHFEFDRILSDSSERKSICLYGSFRNTSGKAIVLLEKKPFDEENVKGLLKNTCPVSQQFFNDIYGNYFCKADADFNEIKATVIHPATEKHVKKYEAQIHHLIEETPNLYETITLPFIQKEQFNLQWITNILEHKSETDRIVCEDTDPETGFVLLPDLKWDGKQIENLYLIAIVRKQGILSLRDLRGCHLDLLQNISKKCVKAIEEKYRFPKSRLRIYFHYQPSFYHLHVHFTNVDYHAPGIHAEKSHLLQSVISNIELMDDYYKKANLMFCVKEGDNLFKEYEEKGLVKKCVT